MILCTGFVCTLASRSTPQSDPFQLKVVMTLHFGFARTPLRQMSSWCGLGSSLGCPNNFTGLLHEVLLPQAWQKGWSSAKSKQLLNVRGEVKHSNFESYPCTVNDDNKLQKKRTHQPTCIARCRGVDVYNCKGHWEKLIWCLDLCTPTMSLPLHKVTSFNAPR